MVNFCSGLVSNSHPKGFALSEVVLKKKTKKSRSKQLVFISIALFTVFHFYIEALHKTFKQTVQTLNVQNTWYYSSLQIVH